jgi:hypothetical protein
MSSETQESSSPTTGRLPTVGRFAFDVTTGAWKWDDEVYRIHGVAPGSIEPTTDYMLRCKHPEDRERVAAAIQGASATGEPFSVTYRLRAADGVERKVVLVCEAGVCDVDAVTQIDGYFIDLTDDFEHETHEAVREAVAASAEHRATIEQAKGSLMLAYGLDPDQAFAMLSWWSRNKNVKVRDLAARLVEVSAQGVATDGGLRQSFDCLLHDISSTAEAREG